MFYITLSLTLQKREHGLAITRTPNTFCYNSCSYSLYHIVGATHLKNWYLFICILLSKVLTQLESIHQMSYCHERFSWIFQRSNLFIRQKISVGLMQCHVVKEVRSACKCFVSLECSIFYSGIIKRYTHILYFTFGRTLLSSSSLRTHSHSEICRQASRKETKHN